jgi:hypothetical protein
MMTALGGRSLLATAITGCCVLLAAAPATALPSSPVRSGLDIVTVSNPRPDLVSGGDVLVRIGSPGKGAVHVSENGRDVSSGFARQPDGTLLGLVTGLRLGRNDISARAGGQVATLTVVDHDRSGPVFSGPRQLPFFCETTAFGLAQAEQPQCSTPTVVTYQYRTTAGAFAPLADPAARPADLATAKVNGRTLPYIVRLETGTIDRAVYQIAALYGGEAPSPLRPDAAWNDRLIYSFGGGCNGGHHQGNMTGGVLNDQFLSQGYAVASSSLNVLENNCSTIISAEAAMMVKEHFVETYGPVAHTIGWGGSGGAIQQYNIADAYPGILDGIVTGVSFPDAFSALNAATDCRLLDRYFAGSSGASFTDAQRQAVAGYVAYHTCETWDGAYANRITPTDSCNDLHTAPDDAIPASAMWDPVTNPRGVKCSAAEQYATQFGRDPGTGFVRNVVDNVGIQYGLEALKQGQISAAQFAALNAGVGGYDRAGRPVARRTQADPQALKAAYRDDVLTSGALGLRTTPIIDQRGYLDQAGGPLFDLHTSEWSYVMRARLLRSNGTAANQVIIENAYTPDQLAAANTYELDAMDRWLTAIDADRSTGDRQAKVIRDRPADLGDGCYLSATQRIRQPLTYPPTGRCAAAYPVGASPRLQAGEPLTVDTLKCHLRPLDFAAYKIRFTQDERAQLRKAFPTGVCDYHHPGVEQRLPAHAWLDYGDR